MKTQNKEKCIHSTLAKVTENTIGLVAFIHSFIYSTNLIEYIAQGTFPTQKE